MNISPTWKQEEKYLKCFVKIFIIYDKELRLTASKIKLVTMESPYGKYCNILNCHKELNLGEERKNKCVAGTSSQWP